MSNDDTKSELASMAWAISLDIANTIVQKEWALLHQVIPVEIPELEVLVVTIPSSTKTYPKERSVHVDWHKRLVSVIGVNPWWSKHIPWHRPDMFRLVEHYLQPSYQVEDLLHDVPSNVHPDLPDGV
jgi:hypothetical protein